MTGRSPGLENHPRKRSGKSCTARSDNLWWSRLFQRKRSIDERGPELSGTAAQAGDRTVQPRVVRQRDIHPDAARVPVPSGDDGLGDLIGTRWVTVEHNGCQDPP